MHVQTWIALKIAAACGCLRFNTCGKATRCYTLSQAQLLPSSSHRKPWSLGAPGLQYVARSFGSDEVHALLRGLVVSICIMLYLQNQQPTSKKGHSEDCHRISSAETRILLSETS